MTRYRAVQVAALLLAGLAASRGHVAWVGGVAVSLVGIVALGVALPGLRFFGPFLCRGTGDNRAVVAITFDDGPDPASTPALLEVLREAQIEAAFFCIGERVASHPDLTAQIAREGHLVENHSYSHSHLTNFFGVRRLRAELERTQATIARATGVAPACFRPPMGLSNPRVFRAAREVGLTVVGWTARGFDTRVEEPERVVRRIVRRLEPGGVILLHDGGIPADRLVVTVRGLLGELRARGYQVARLDRVLGRGDVTGVQRAERGAGTIAVVERRSASRGAQLGGEARGAS